MKRLRVVSLMLIFALLCNPTVIAFHAPPWDTGHNSFTGDPGNTNTEPGGTGPGRCGSPVEIATGNFIFSSRHLLIPALGPSLELTLVYNSQDLRQSLFGNGWTHSYDQRLIVTTDGSQVFAVLRQPDGKRDRFKRNSDGTYTPPPSIHSLITRNTDGTHVLREPNGMTRRFDIDGKLVSLTDRNGNVLTLSYDQAGFITRVTDASNRKLQFTRGTNGRVSTITDPANRVFRYSYDVKGNLISFADPLGNVGSLQYDSTNRLEAIRDQRNNQRLRLTYDNSGRVTTFSDGAETWTYTYQPTQKRTIERDSSNNSWTFNYNDSGSIIKRTDPLNNSESLTYDNDLNLSDFTDKNGNKTVYTYDPKGNLLTTKDALGNLNSITYESTFSQPLTVKDARGKITSYQYDTHGNLTKITDPLDHVTMMQYDQKGQLTRITDAEENTFTFTYDSFGNLIKSADPLNNTTQKTYDVLGKVTSLIDALGRKTLYVYDNGERLVQVINAKNDAIRYDYDTANNITAITLPNGAQTKYEFDAFNRVTRATNSLNQSRTYTYDAKNNLTSITDPNGRRINYSYNSLSRLITKSKPEGAVNYSYDKVGNLIGVTDVNSNLSYSYDALNRVISAKTGLTPAQPSTTISYTYDALGRRISMTDPAAGVSTYTFDDKSKLKSITDPSGLVVSFAYDKLSRRTQLIRAGKTITNYTYDGAGNLSSLDHQSPVGRLTFGYTYDSIGSRITMAETGNIRNFAYDALYQLTGTTHSSNTLPKEAYSYDQLGNRVTSHLSPSYTHNLANRLTADGVFDYTYDADGNVITKKERANGLVTSYTYDSENKLTRINFPTGSSATYKYDALGRRIEKNIAGEVTRYVYDRQDILFEYSGTGTVNARYVHGPGVDEILAMRRGTVTYLFENDALTSVVRITTGTSVAGVFTYDSYGRVIAQTNSSLSPYAFQGREFDQESGLYYFRERYYDPQTGRFLSQDPLGFAAGANYYAFVSNNPINGWDPFGLSGTITINSSGNGGISGHSWITYTTDSGNTKTYGTWGNNPDGKGYGLLEDVELSMRGDTSRSMHLDDSAEQRFLNEVQRYKDMGENGWGYTNPCSGFASDAWKSATGEFLDSRNIFGISTPTNLKESINNANKKGGQCTFGGSSAGSNSSSSSTNSSSVQSSNSSINSSSRP